MGVFNDWGRNAEMSVGRISRRVKGHRDTSRDGEECHTAPPEAYVPVVEARILAHQARVQKELERLGLK